MHISVRDRVNKFTIEWEAHEYEHKERGSDWHWAVGILAISFAVVAVIFGKIILGLLIIIGTFSLTLFINRPPEIIRGSVNERGISRGNTLYPYETIESFWIDIDHPHKKIILKSRKIFMPLIVVPIADNVDPYRLERILSRYLKEEYHALPFVERLLEHLGF
jgi:hypothetical protein